MKRTRRFLSIIFFAALIAGCSATPDVDSEKGACYLKAVHSDVYVKVFDLDRDGNMGPLIWQGRINQNETARIKTPHAYFRYYYNSEPDVDQPLSGGFDKDCDDLDVVVVP